MRWRKEALEAYKKEKVNDNVIPRSHCAHVLEMSERILRMTQILLDQDLMKGK